jgi:hypothetical protein
MRQDCRKIQHRWPVMLLPGQLFYRLAARRSWCPNISSDSNNVTIVCSCSKDAMTIFSERHAILSPALLAFFERLSPVPRAILPNFCVQRLNLLCRCTRRHNADLLESVCNLFWRTSKLVRQ